MRLNFKNLLFFISLCFFCAAGGFARSAVDSEEPFCLIRESTSVQRSSLFLSVSVDHKDCVYDDGDLVKITVNAGDNGYLYLVHKDVEGNFALLFPNIYEKDCEVSKCSAIVIPPENRYNFRIRAPFGEEELIAVLSKEKLEIKKNLELVFEKERTKDVVPLTLEEVKSFAGEILSRAEKDSGAVAESHVKIVTQEEQAVPDDTGKGMPGRYLFCVGVNQYCDRNIRNLDCCARDADGMERVFCSFCGVNKEHVYKLTGEDASFENIQKHFTKKLAKIPAASTLFIYWSGHGGYAANTGSENAKETLACLYPYDGIRKNVHNGVTEDLLGHWIDGLKDKNIVLILDACYSRAITNSTGKGIADGKGLGDSFEEELPEIFTFGLRAFARTKSVDVKDKSVITSSTSDEISLAAKSGEKNSLMTKYILSVIEKENCSSAVLTPKMLVDLIKDDVAREAKERKGDGGSQTVFAEGDTIDTVNFFE